MSGMRSWHTKSGYDQTRGLPDSEVFISINRKEEVVYTAAPTYMSREEKILYTEAQTQLSSQVLHCCQALFREGCPLLYDSARLVIHANDEGISALASAITFRDMLRVPDRFTVCGLNADHLERKYQADQERTRRMLAAAWQVTASDIVIDYTESKTVGRVVYALREMLANKRVRLNMRRYRFRQDLGSRRCQPIGLTDFHISSPYYGSLGFDHHSTVKVYNDLEILKNLRCWSLEIHDTLVAEDIKAAVVEVVTSASPFYDLVVSHDELDRSPLANFLGLADSRIKDKIYNTIADLARPAYCAEVEEYLKGYRVVAEMVGHELELQHHYEIDLWNPKVTVRHIDRKSNRFWA